MFHCRGVEGGGDDVTGGGIPRSAFHRETALLNAEVAL